MRWQKCILKTGFPRYSFLVREYWIWIQKKLTWAFLTNYANVGKKIYIYCKSSTKDLGSSFLLFEFVRTLKCLWTRSGFVQCRCFTFCCPGLLHLKLKPEQELVPRLPRSLVSSTGSQAHSCIWFNNKDSMSHNCVRASNLN